MYLLVGYSSYCYTCTNSAALQKLTSSLHTYIHILGLCVYIIHHVRPRSIACCFVLWSFIVAQCSFFAALLAAGVERSKDINWHWQWRKESLYNVAINSDDRSLAISHTLLTSIQYTIHVFIGRLYLSIYNNLVITNRRKCSILFFYIPPKIRLNI